MISYTSTFIETCRCPDKVSSNYYLLPPYIDMNGKQLFGVFYQILDEMIQFTCGLCARAQLEHRNSVLDMYKNGRSSYSLKTNELRVILNIDDHTDLSFPIIGTKDQRFFMGYPYISLVDYPGAVILVKDKSLNEIVNSKVISLLNVWPLIAVMLLMSVVIGLLVWLFVSLTFQCIIYTKWSHFRRKKKI